MRPWREAFSDYLRTDHVVRCMDHLFILDMLRNRP